MRKCTMIIGLAILALALTAVSAWTYFVTGAA